MNDYNLKHPSRYLENLRSIKNGLRVLLSENDTTKRCIKLNERYSKSANHQSKSSKCSSMEGNKTQSNFIQIISSDDLLQNVDYFEVHNTES